MTSSRMVRSFGLPLRHCQYDVVCTCRARVLRKVLTITANTLWSLMVRLVQAIRLQETVY